MNGELFPRDREEIPRDIVPGSGLTREDLRRMNDATGKPCTGTIPGQVICDVDGVPIGVEPSREVASIFGGVVITRADAERLNVTPDEFPNVRILPERSN